MGCGGREWEIRWGKSGIGSGGRIAQSSKKSDSKNPKVDLSIRGKRVRLYDLGRREMKKIERVERKVFEDGGRGSSY